MKKNPIKFKKSATISIRTLNIQTGKQDQVNVKVNRNENLFYNIKRNEKGTLISSPLAKVFGWQTDYFRKEGEDFKSITANR